MEKNIETSACGCPGSNPPLKQTKYYQEIGAEVIGNQLLIRVEKDKNKMKKKSSSDWDPPCHCGSIPEIKRPTRTQGPRIVNIDKDNQIIFRINSKSKFNCEDPNYQPEVMSYQLGEGSHDPGRTLIVHPQCEGSGPQEIHQDHATINNQNIFLLKIKKKSDLKEQKNRNIELEINYPNLPPRIPTPPPTPPPRSPPPSPLFPEAAPEIDKSKSLEIQPKKKAKKKKKKKGKNKKKKK